MSKLSGNTKNKRFAHGEMVSTMGKLIYVIPFPHGQIFSQPPDAFCQPPDATFK